MNWAILFLIAIVIAAIILATCGIGGGFMMLVILNGFSESAATPILIVFALLVLGISIALSTAVSWMFIKARHAETAIQFWHIVGINTGANLLVILITVAIIVIIRLL